MKTATNRPLLPTWDRIDCDRQRRSGQGLLSFESLPRIDPCNNDWLDEIIPPSEVEEEEGPVLPPNIGWMMEHSDLPPQFSIRFNPEKLAAIDWGELAYRGDRTITKEASEENLRQMADRFARLPELHFESGQTYYVFGPNGSGKSVLCDAILYAIQVKHHELAKGTQVFADRARELGYEPSMYASLPDTTNRQRNTTDDGIPELIKQVAGVIEVDTLVTSETADNFAEFGCDLTGGYRFAIGAAYGTAWALSGAQMARSGLIEKVDIARSDGHGPDRLVVVLDEPETSLDRHQVARLEADLENTRLRYGKTTIALVVTHLDSIDQNPTKKRIDLGNPEAGIHQPGEEEIARSYREWVDSLPPGNREILSKVIAEVY
jgi:ABC-type lipoprotein export system ATPase subunit